MQLLMGKLSKSDYLKIRQNIIKKLYSKKAFVKGHLLYERLASGIPSHLAGFVEEVPINFPSASHSK